MYGEKVSERRSTLAKKEKNEQLKYIYTQHRATVVLVIIEEGVGG